MGLPQSIVNRGDWLGSSANIKGANKDAKIYVGRSATLHNLLFCPHTLCMNYVTNTFLLVSSSRSSKQILCFVQGQGQKTEQKHRTKNFDEFHNHSPLLTMNEHTVRGTPTLKVVKRFRKGSVCKAYDRSIYERAFCVNLSRIMLCQRSYQPGLSTLQLDHHHGLALRTKI